MAVTQAAVILAALLARPPRQDDTAGQAEREDDR
jgi:hypothetical protein